MKRRTFLSLLVGSAAARLGRLFPWLAPAPAATLPAEFYDITSVAYLIQPSVAWWSSPWLEVYSLTRGDSDRVQNMARDILHHERRRLELGRRVTAPTAEEAVRRARALEPVVQVAA